MITAKRISQTRLAKVVAERETLTTCPACQGNGYRALDSGGRYRRVACKWCETVGWVVPVVAAMYRRAARIFEMRRRGAAG